MDSLEKIADIIKTKDNYFILGHIEPDGDCIGSMVALKEIIKNYDKNYQLIFYEKPEEKYNFLLKDDYNIFSQMNFNKEDLSDINLIALDAGDRERLGEIIKIKKNILINIDHHKNNPLYARYNYVEPAAAAVGEILYELVENLKIEINYELGTAIAAAIIYDTGFLKYQNTSAKILRLIADLMDKGIDLYRINNHLFASNSYNIMKLKGKALSTLKTDPTGKIAWLYIDKDMLSETNCSQRDVSGFVNYARDIKNVEVGICFTETIEGKTKVSFRSKEYIEVNKIAEMFAGGGHPRAAGCTLKKGLNKTIKIILQEVKKFV